MDEINENQDKLFDELNAVLNKITDRIDDIKSEYSESCPENISGEDLKILVTKGVLATRFIEGANLVMKSFSELVSLEDHIDNDE